MKTSKKILLAVAIFVIALLITGLLMLRNEVQLQHSKALLKNKYKPVTVAEFKGLDFSAGWVVRIRHGKEYKVELEIEEGSKLKPRLENINGTLFFKMEGKDPRDSTGSIRVKITAPSLQSIKAASGTAIHLENFESDSLKVILENGGTFTEHNSEIAHLSFKTSGEATLEFTKDMMP